MNFSIVLLCFTKTPFPRMVPLHMPLPFNPAHPCVGCGKFPLNMEQAQIGWGLSMERDTQTMNPRLTAMVEVVEVHAMTSSNCRQFSRRSLFLGILHEEALYVRMIQIPATVESEGY